MKVDTVGDVIRELRELRDFTQEELAHELGISASFLCDIEKNRRGLTHERVRQFAQLLDVSPAALTLDCPGCEVLRVALTSAGDGEEAGDG